MVGPNQRKTKSRNQAKSAAMEANENATQERCVLTRVRLELESLRILLQRINKREKLKRDGQLPQISEKMKEKTSLYLELVFKLLLF